jgi:hypothetical protein
MAAHATAQAAPQLQSASATGTMTTTGIGSTSGGRAQTILRLRGANEEGNGSMEEGGRGRGRRIQWAEDVVDNEGLGRKSSKGGFLISFFPSLCISLSLSLSFFSMDFGNESKSQSKS